METFKLSTLIRFVDPNLEEMLTTYELETPIVLRDGIDSVTNKDVLEIIEASIIEKKQGALIH